MLNMRNTHFVRVCTCDNSTANGRDLNSSPLLSSHVEMLVCDPLLAPDLLFEKVDVGGPKIPLCGLVSFWKDRRALSSS